MSEEAPENPPEKPRANYVASPNILLLNQACVLINRAFNSRGKLRCGGCYLVGSALKTKHYRDVDVRFIMVDDEYDRFFKDEGATPQWLDSLWSLMCTSISMYLSTASGLQVDFQIQRMTQANEEHKGARSALGIFFDYPGERPSDCKEEEKKEEHE